LSLSQTDGHQRKSQIPFHQYGSTSKGSFLFFRHNIFFSKTTVFFRQRKHYREKVATKKVKIIGKIRDSRFRAARSGVTVRDDRYELGQDHCKISTQIVLRYRPRDLSSSGTKTTENSSRYP